MIPDSATTPIKPLRQFLLGFAVAPIYGLMFVLDIPFGLFFALAAMSAMRGISLYVAHLNIALEPAPTGALAPGASAAS